MKCGKPVLGERQEYCHDCMHTHHYYDRGFPLWLHREPVSQSVYQFKFHNQREFAKYYVEEILYGYDAIIRAWNPDFIIPVPMYPGKQRKRGYNQAQILAEELGKRMDIPVEHKIVRRVKKTIPQKRLEPLKRKMNLESAFEIQTEKDSDILSGKTVLLVDDIYTTGSTIDAVSKILKKAGVQKVYYLSISIGQGY